MLCRSTFTCRLDLQIYNSHINELNEHISNERKLVEKLKFVRTKLPIYQSTKLATKSMQRQCDLI